MRLSTRLLSTLALALGLGAPVGAQPFFFTTGDPDGRIGVATHVASADGSKIEVEAADDFILDSQTLLYGAVITGVMPADFTADDIGTIQVEIYRVFPNDSDTSRTPNVPTRTNSPGDVAFQSRSTDDGNLVFTFVVTQIPFQVSNSVINGINPSPNQNTQGEAPVEGWLTSFIVLFTDEFILPPDHYFFKPSIQVKNNLGEFLWASAPHDPPQFQGDLQQWVRDSNLAPDWLRVGTDIVGGTTFNGSFSLIGQIYPNP
jgi:hypothetical protein